MQEVDAGYVAGEIHGLITAIEDKATECGTERRCKGTEILGADGTAVGRGAKNTLYILAGRSEDGIGAKLATDYKVTEDGVTYDDWFLPSMDELNLRYLNRPTLPSHGNFDNTWYFSFTK